MSKTSPLTTRYLIGVHSTPKALFASIAALRKQSIPIHEAYTPYPIHGLDEALGYKRSRLPIGAFLFGLLGTVLAVTMQTSMMAVDWPMNIGGKNFFSLPTFVPVIFELTVLLAAFGMVGLFFYASNLKPWGRTQFFDRRATDDKFILVLPVVDPLQRGLLEGILRANGAEDVQLQDADHDT